MDKNPSPTPRLRYQLTGAAEDWVEGPPEDNSSRSERQVLAEELLVLLYMSRTGPMTVDELANELLALGRSFLKCAALRPIDELPIFAGDAAAHAARMARWALMVPQTLTDLIQAGKVEAVSTSK